MKTEMKCLLEQNTELLLLDHQSPHLRRSLKKRLSAGRAGQVPKVLQVVKVPKVLQVVKLVQGVKFSETVLSQLSGAFTFCGTEGGEGGQTSPDITS